MTTEFQKQVKGLAVTGERVPVRPEPRDEDPRERALKRTAEIRGHSGGITDGTDEFYIDPAIIPEGWTYEWKRRLVINQEDPSYQVHLARMGWEAVPARRHPQLMPLGSHHQTIERKGMILMERPKEITDEARSIELRRARMQVRAKEEQLAAAPPGQFERNNKDAALVKIKKSFESMAIPEE